AALAGLALALVRRNVALLLLALPALVAYLITSPSASPYIDAKLLAILSPFVVATAAYAIARIPRRPLAIALGVVLGIALLASDALAYRMALPAPIARLDELARIDAMY